jgi:hypothetical protein
MIATKSLDALTNGVTVNDVILSGTATTTASPDTQTGSAILMANRSNSSRIELNLNNDKRTEVRNTTAGIPSGSWNVNDGPSKALSQHNDWTDASWFFPALTSLTDPNAVLTYIGQEQLRGMAVYHLRSYRPNVTKFAEQLSQMDFYVDTASYLPTAITFSTHPDDNASLDIPVEIVYSDYQPFNGVLVPIHVQRYLQGSLTLDVIVTSVTINSGLSNTEFAVR